MNENLKMVRGDTFSFTIEISNLTSDLTGAYFSCKKNKDDTEYIFQKDLTDGIEKSSETTTSKSYKITVAPADTDGVDEGNYFYDLQIEVDDEVFTPLLGVLNIVADITVPTSASL